MTKFTIKEYLSFFGNSIYRNFGNVAILGFYYWQLNSAFEGGYSAQEFYYYSMINISRYLAPALLMFFYYRVYRDAVKLKK